MNKMKKGKKSTKSVEASEDLVLDYAGKKLIGIEIIDASKRLGKKDLKNFTLTIPTYKANLQA